MVIHVSVIAQRLASHGYSLFMRYIGTSHPIQVRRRQRSKRGSDCILFFVEWPLMIGKIHILATKIQKSWKLFGTCTIVFG